MGQTQTLDEVCTKVDKCSWTENKLGIGSDTNDVYQPHYSSYAHTMCLREQYPSWAHIRFWQARPNPSNYMLDLGENTRKYILQTVTIVADAPGHSYEYFKIKHLVSPLEQGFFCNIVYIRNPTIWKHFALRDFHALR